MDRVDIAEWLLRQVTDPSRAAELIGDQLEADPSADKLRFWLTVGRLLLAFSWRTVVGFEFSMIAGILLGFVSLFVVWDPENSVGHILLYACGISILLWTATIFSLIRFGWRDSLPRIGVITSVLWSGSFCFFWHPTSAIALLIVWTGYLVFCMRTKERRASLVILLAAAAAAWLTGFALSLSGHNSDNVFSNWGGLAALLLVPLVESGLTILLHRKWIALPNKYSSTGSVS